MPRQHGHLPCHYVGLAEQVASIRVARCQRQGAALTRAAHDDRHALLDGSRVAHRFGDRDRLAGKARRSLAPQQRQCLQCIFQVRIPSVDRRELDARGRVFLGEPSDAEAAHRSTARQHVDGCDLLGQRNRLMAKRRRDQHTEPYPFGGSRQPGQGDVGIGHVGPGRADLGDLTEVVHHPDVVDADSLCLRGDRTQTLGQSFPSARPIEARQVKADADTGRARPGRLTRGSARRSLLRQRRRDHHDRFGRQQLVPRLGDDGVADRRPSTELVADDISGNRHLARNVASPAFGRGRVEQHRDARYARGASQLPPSSALVGVEAQGVDHGCQPAAHSAGHDLTEHSKSVG